MGGLKKIIFRCDAGGQVGLGHLQRCRALAASLQLRGATNVIVGPANELQTEGDRQVFSSWIPTPWHVNDAAQTARVAKEHGASWLVLDDYRVDEEYQLSLRGHGLSWLQFETRTDRLIWADCILNAWPGVIPEDYASNQRNPDARFLLGPRYAIIRSEFNGNDRCNLATRDVRQIMVSFGGGDDRGALIRVLSGLKPMSEGYEFVVIAGRNNPRNHSNQQWIESAGISAKYLVEPPVAKVMAGCVAGVIAGGTSITEALRCGLPVLVLAIADNQVGHCQAWQRTNYIQYLSTLDELNDDKLQAGFADFLKSIHGMRRRIVENMPVDGLGADRVAAALISQLGTGT